MKNLKINFLKIFFSLSFVLLAFFSFWIIFESENLPPPELLGKKITNTGIEIYDRTGKVLLYKKGFQRLWVDFEEIPEKVIKTILVAEDIEFYQHKGVSLKGILRSIYLNLKHGSLEYGGSTITQQLVRNLFLSRKKTIFRKIKEIILALKLEEKYTKNEILTYYFNSIYYGEGNLGIKSASNYYFDKDLKDLTWGESAVLAAIPKSPLLYIPTNKENLERLKIRRDYILKRLKDLGWIDEKEYQEGINEEIKINKNKYKGMLAPHFVVQVLQELQKFFPNQDLEELNLKVITTLDYDLQKIAEESVKKGANRNKEKYGGKNASLMAIDPRTGEVLVLVGSKDFFDESISGQVNVPFSYRQPGSAFKPISYAVLLEKGYPESTIIFDVPTDFGDYQPSNFDKKFKGPVSLRQALAESRNIPAVKVFYLAKPEDVVNLARKIAPYLKDWKNYGLSMALGTAEMRMADLIRLYGALANDGVLVSQSLILEIYQDNKLIYKYQPKEEQIISPQTARVLNNILKDVQARKGLFSKSLKYTVFPGYEVALKTGTTQFYQDAWTFGYTPEIAIGVWAGNTDGRRMNSLGASLVAALPIFHDFLSQVISLEKISPQKFPFPEEYFVSKPMLNSSWISEYGVYSILFYVNRDDPLGPIPENPYLDPQFENWERGIKNWFYSNQTLF